MITKEIKSKKLYKEFQIEIPYEVIENKIIEKINNIIPTVSMPGFRKGKAPINIVRKKYEDSVLNEIIDFVAKDQTSKLLKEKKFNIFRPPLISLKKFEKNQNLEIIIKIDIQPDIQLKDFKKLKFNDYNIKLNKKDKDENFDKFISFQKNYKKLDKLRSIILSDRVTIDMKSLDKNVPEFFKEQKNLPIDTDSDYQILPDLSKKLIEKKVKVGDNIKLKFNLPDNKNNKKDIEFGIKIKSIEERVSFKITDEFLAKNGFKKEADLRKRLDDELFNNYNKSLDQIQKKEIMDKLDKEYNFELPEGILDEEFENIWHKIEHAKKDGTLDSDDKGLSDKDLKKRYQKISQRRVKLAILIRHISEKEKIEINQDELSKAMIEYTSQYPGQEKQIIEYFKNNPKSLESLKGPILEQKVIDKIISSSTISKRDISVSDYKKLEEKVFNINKEIQWKIH